MKDLQHVKAIAEQMFSLSSELLRLVDMDETERRLFLEEVKKNAAGKVLYFPGVKKEDERQQNNTFALKSTFYFTKKEISRMPEEFQKVITIKLPIYVRQKANGVYEARFRAHGYNISVSSVDYDELKPKFILKLANYTPPQIEAAIVEELPAPARPLLTETAERWLELKRPTIKPTTHAYYVQLLGANIYPAFYGALSGRAETVRHTSGFKCVHRARQVQNGNEDLPNVKRRF